MYVCTCSDHTYVVYNLSIKKLWNFKDFFIDWLTYLLTNAFRQAYLENSYVWLKNLISSPINVASSRDVSFHQLQQLWNLHHGVTFVPLCVPILSLQLPKVTIFSKHVMATVQERKITEAFPHYCSLILLWNKFTIAEIEALWLSRTKIGDASFTSEISVWAGWIAEMLFMLFLAYIAV